MKCCAAVTAPLFLHGYTGHTPMALTDEPKWKRWISLGDKCRILCVTSIFFPVQLGVKYFNEAGVLENAKEKNRRIK